jgi:hypothetical protein
MDYQDEWDRLVQQYGPRQAVRFALNGERRWQEREAREKLARERKQANAKLQGKKLADVVKRIKTG